MSSSDDALDIIVVCDFRLLLLLIKMITPTTIAAIIIISNRDPKAPDREPPPLLLPPKPKKFEPSLASRCTGGLKLTVPFRKRTRAFCRSSVYVTLSVRGYVPGVVLFSSAKGILNGRGESASRSPKY